MFRIVKKEELNPTVTKIVVEAPLIAKKAQPGQFIIFRATQDGERVPLTIADFDRENGTVTIIFQIVGRATMELNSLEEGDCICDFAGPLGTPSKVENLKNLRENIEYGEQAEDLLMAAKYFERIDDHVTNFEWVIFSITGCHVDDE